jgi:membrane-bound metal-dependent hydrolase YbcI (DUF457 family)
MAGFNTHISTSTAVGIAYGVAGHVYAGLPPTVAAVAGGLCSIAGILPDVDSDSGKPVREISGFASAVIPLLLIPRLERLGLAPESVVLAGGCIYILVRFGFFELLRRYTVHRGMWHSIPAAFVAGLATALLCADQELRYRLFKVGAVVLGYLTHLILDELWSFQIRGIPRVKRSFGSALKLWSGDRWANVSVYSKLILCLVLLLSDPTIRQHLPAETDSLYRVAHDVWQETVGHPAPPQREYR